MCTRFEFKLSEMRYTHNRAGRSYSKHSLSTSGHNLIICDGSLYSCGYNLCVSAMCVYRTGPSCAKIIAKVDAILKNICLK